MATVHRGQIDERIEVADLLTVIGVVQGGAHVGPGATLRVEGELHGLLTIEVEGTAVVDGVVSGEVVNHGYLMVAGRLTGRVSHDAGMIAVAAGSVVTTPDGGVGHVDADGRLQTGAAHLGGPVDKRNYLRRLDAARYVPLPGRR